jgi:exonuclease-1
MQGWRMSDFRRMCILSGCDYLPSIPQLGLKRANKLLRQHKTVERVVIACRLEYNLRVPDAYLEKFRMAELTFLHQRVFSIKEKKIVHLTPIDDQNLDPELIDKVTGL